MLPDEVGSSRGRYGVCDESVTKMILWYLPGALARTFWRSRAGWVSLQVVWTFGEAPPGHEADVTTGRSSEAASAPPGDSLHQSCSSSPVRMR